MSSAYILGGLDLLAIRCFNSVWSVFDEPFAIG